MSRHTSSAHLWVQMFKLLLDLVFPAKTHRGR